METSSQTKEKRQKGQRKKTTTDSANVRRSSRIPSRRSEKLAKTDYERPTSKPHGGRWSTMEKQLLLRTLKERSAVTQFNYLGIKRAVKSKKKEDVEHYMRNLRKRTMKAKIESMRKKSPIEVWKDLMDHFGDSDKDPIHVMSKVMVMASMERTKGAEEIASSDFKPLRVYRYLGALFKSKELPKLTALESQVILDCFQNMLEVLKGSEIRDKAAFLRSQYFNLYDKAYAGGNEYNQEDSLSLVFKEMEAKAEARNGTIAGEPQSRMDPSLPGPSAGDTNPSTRSDTNGANPGASKDGPASGTSQAVKGGPGGPKKKASWHRGVDKSTDQSTDQSTDRSTEVRILNPLGIPVEMLEFKPRDPNADVNSFKRWAYETDSSSDDDDNFFDENESRNLPTPKKRGRPSKKDNGKNDDDAKTIENNFQGSGGSGPADAIELQEMSELLDTDQYAFVTEEDFAQKGQMYLQALTESHANPDQEVNVTNLVESDQYVFLGKGDFPTKDGIDFEEMDEEQREGDDATSSTALDEADLEAESIRLSTASRVFESEPIRMDYGDENDDGTSNVGTPSQIEQSDDDDDDGIDEFQLLNDDIDQLDLIGEDSSHAVPDIDAVLPEERQVRFDVSDLEAGTTLLENAEPVSSSSDHLTSITAQVTRSDGLMESNLLSTSSRTISQSLGAPATIPVQTNLTQAPTDPTQAPTDPTQAPTNPTQAPTILLKSDNPPDKDSHKQNPQSVVLDRSKTPSKGRDLQFFVEQGNKSSEVSVQGIQGNTPSNTIPLVSALSQGIVTSDQGNDQLLTIDVSQLGPDSNIVIPSYLLPGGILTIRSPDVPNMRIKRSHPPSEVQTPITTTSNSTKELRSHAQVESSSPSQLENITSDEPDLEDDAESISDDDISQTQYVIASDHPSTESGELCEVHVIASHILKPSNQKEEPLKTSSKTLTRTESPAKGVHTTKALNTSDKFKGIHPEPDSDEEETFLDFLKSQKSLFSYRKDSPEASDHLDLEVDSGKEPIDQPLQNNIGIEADATNASQNATPEQSEILESNNEYSASTEDPPQGSQERLDKLLASGLYGVVLPKKRMGRPPKIRTENSSRATVMQGGSRESFATVAKRRRGRPPKSKFATTGESLLLSDSEIDGDVADHPRKSDQAANVGLEDLESQRVSDEMAKEMQPDVRTGDKKRGRPQKIDQSSALFSEDLESQNTKNTEADLDRMHPDKNAGGKHRDHPGKTKQTVSSGLVEMQHEYNVRKIPVSKKKPGHPRKMSFRDSSDVEDEVLTARTHDADRRDLKSVREDEEKKKDGRTPRISTSTEKPQEDINKSLTEPEVKRRKGRPSKVTSRDPDDDMEGSCDHSLLREEQRNIEELRSESSTENSVKTKRGRPSKVSRHDLENYSEDNSASPSTERKARVEKSLLDSDNNPEGKRKRGRQSNVIRQDSNDGHSQSRQRKAGVGASESESDVETKEKRRGKPSKVNGPYSGEIRSPKGRKSISERLSSDSNADITVKRGRGKPSKDTQPVSKEIPRMYKERKDDVEQLSSESNTHKTDKEGRGRSSKINSPESDDSHNQSRNRKDDVEQSGSESLADTTEKRGRGRPSKTRRPDSDDSHNQSRIRKDDVEQSGSESLSDTTEKRGRGRPSKTRPDSDDSHNQSRNRKDDVEQSGSESSADTTEKRGRGRPSKTRRPDSDDSHNQSTDRKDDAEHSSSSSVANSTEKKRRRPTKVKSLDSDDSHRQSRDNDPLESKSGTETKKKLKRGRPSKLSSTDSNDGGNLSEERKARVEQSGALSGTQVQEKSGSGRQPQSSRPASDNKPSLSKEKKIHIERSGTESDSEVKEKPRRGRPRKETMADSSKDPVENLATEASLKDMSDIEMEIDSSKERTEKRGKGRPRKEKVPDFLDDLDDIEANSRTDTQDGQVETNTGQKKRKRGRPRSIDRPESSSSVPKDVDQIQQTAFQSSGKSIKNRKTESDSESERKEKRKGEISYGKLGQKSHGDVALDPLKRQGLPHTSRGKTGKRGNPDSDSILSKTTPSPHATAEQTEAIVNSSPSLNPNLSGIIALNPALRAQIVGGVTQIVISTPATPVRGEEKPKKGLQRYRKILPRPENAALSPPGVTQGNLILVTQPPCFVMQQKKEDEAQKPKRARSHRKWFADHAKEKSTIKSNTQQKTAVQSKTFFDGRSLKEKISNQSSELSSKSPLRTSGRLHKDSHVHPNEVLSNRTEQDQINNQSELSHTQQISNLQKELGPDYSIELHDGTDSPHKAAAGYSNLSPRKEKRKQVTPRKVERQDSALESDTERPEKRRRGRPPKTVNPDDVTNSSEMKNTSANKKESKQQTQTLTGTGQASLEPSVRLENTAERVSLTGNEIESDSQRSPESVSPPESTKVKTVRQVHPRKESKQAGTSAEGSTSTLQGTSTCDSLARESGPSQTQDEHMKQASLDRYFTSKKAGPRQSPEKSSKVKTQQSLVSSKDAETCQSPSKSKKEKDPQTPKSPVKHKKSESNQSPKKSKETKPHPSPSKPKKTSTHPSPLKSNKSQKPQSPIKSKKSQKPQSPVKSKKSQKPQSPIKSKKSQKSQSPVKSKKSGSCPSPVKAIPGILKKTKKRSPLKVNVGKELAEKRQKSLDRQREANGETPPFTNDPTVSPFPESDLLFSKPKKRVSFEAAIDLAEGLEEGEVLGKDLFMTDVVSSTKIKEVMKIVKDVQVGRESIFDQQPQKKSVFFSLKKL